jgi:hypothetical protein
MSIEGAGVARKQERLLSACKRARLILGMVPKNSKAYAPETMEMLDEAIGLAEENEAKEKEGK